MGKIDTATKEYMENPVVFANAFNQFLYHGEQKIDPARLIELDTTGIVVPYGADGASVPDWMLGCAPFLKRNVFQHQQRDSCTRTGLQCELTLFTL